MNNTNSSSHSTQHKSHLYNAEAPQEQQCKSSNEGATAGVDPRLGTVAAFDLQRISLSAINDRLSDTVALVTPHEEFKSIQWGELKGEGGQLLVLDRHNTFDPAEIANSDHRLSTIGVGGRNNV